MIDTEVLWKVYGQGLGGSSARKSEPTVDHFHVGCNPGQEGTDHEEGITKRMHIGMESVMRRRVKVKSDPS